MVKAGQVLFLMDKKPFQAQLDGAAAALCQAEGRHGNGTAEPGAHQAAGRPERLVPEGPGRCDRPFESSAAAVEQAKAQLETAQLNLSYCTITSPVTGITGAALQQDGTYINQQNSQLTTVAVLSPMWVNFSLSENEMQRFRDQIARKLIIRPAGRKLRGRDHPGRRLDLPPHRDRSPSPLLPTTPRPARS